MLRLALRVIVFVVGLMLAYQVGVDAGKNVGLKQGREEGQMVACSTALHGFSNLMAQFGMYLHGTAACRMDGDVVVFDQIFDPLNKATFNLDLSEHK